MECHKFTFFSIFVVVVTFLNRECNGLTWPEPAGPFYGFSYSTDIARRFPIPASAYGKCQAGKTYTITSPQDLKNQESELQCIFTAGLTPSKVPEGPQPGQVLLALNSRHFLINPLVSLVWRGNFAFKAECNATLGSPSEIYVGFHNALNGRAVLPALVHISKLQGNFAQEECEDGRPSVIMDFTQNLGKICPDYRDFVERNKDWLPTTIDVKRFANFYPNTQILDVFRLVGRMEDGGRIYLGKTYFKDAFRSDEQLATIAFWYVINHDDEVNPEFAVGESLPPLKYSYDYTFPGVADIILRFLPFDNLLTRPFATVGNLGRESRTFLTNLWLRLTEYFRSIGTRRASRRKLRQYFRDATIKAKTYSSSERRNSPATTTEAPVPLIPNFSGEDSLVDDLSIDDFPTGDIPVEDLTNV